MTAYCENCKCFLRDIAKHLEEKHGVHVQLGEDSHLAYCTDCHKYLGKMGTRVFAEQRKALEHHLQKHHDVHMNDGTLNLEL